MSKPSWLTENEQNNRARSLKLFCANVVLTVIGRGVSACSFHALDGSSILGRELALKRGSPRPRPLPRPRGRPRLLPRVDEPRVNGGDLRRTPDAFVGSGVVQRCSLRGYGRVGRDWGELAKEGSTFDGGTRVLIVKPRRMSSSPSHVPQTP